MPRGVHLSDKTKEQIYTSFTLGESPEDIAASMDLNPGTVRRIVREQRKLHERMREEMARSGKIVKKDGNGGKLMALSPEGFEFTHVTPDGKSHKKKVSGHISRVAEQQYDKWCTELDDECEFMHRVERKVDAVVSDVNEAFVPTDEYVQVFEDDEPDGTDASFGEVVCGYPGDPIEEIHTIEPAPVPEINVRPWREVAEERLRDIKVLEQRVEYLEGRLEGYETAPESISRAPSYLLWAKTSTPKVFGLYGSMEAALKEVDQLNEVAKFLGSDGAFEVEEVQWKG